MMPKTSARPSAERPTSAFQTALWARLALGLLLAAPLACADRQDANSSAGAASTAAVSDAAEIAIPSIEPTELAARLASEGGAPLVLDVRTQKEFDAGHIPGALHIPHDELAERIDEVDTSKGIAVHCMVGPRARMAEATLAAAGVTNIMHLEGGYRAWMKAGLETAN